MLPLLKVRTFLDINTHKLLRLKVIFKRGNYSNENKSPKIGLLSAVVARAMQSIPAPYKSQGGKRIKSLIPAWAA